ncbi:MAG: ATP-dependent DNA helicase RecG, partial [Phycisphaerales bacterium]|nr:ATP-dependent DNA helicase RecG [Phycisphaerales bacterium]
MAAPPPAISLSTRLADLPPTARVRPAHVNALAALGVNNVGQLLAHLPARHEFQEAEAPISSLTAGALVTARGEISATRVVNKGRLPRFEAVLMDDTGRLDLVFFNMPHMRHSLHPGMRVRVYGKAQAYGPGLQLANPKVEPLRDESKEPAAADSRLRPVYPASELIPSRAIEEIIARILEPALPLIEDHLPEPYRKQRELPELAAAYRMMHAPASEGEIAAARRRLAYDELLMLQLGVFLRRAQLRAAHRSPPIPWSEAIDARIRRRFPFSLTEAQEAVIREIVADLARPDPANRLIQGDVGSGKTAVAVYAMLCAVAAGHQAALMAPTELLAEQHDASISHLLANSKVRVRLLTGSLAAAERESTLAAIASGDVDITIGTHALLTEHVRFSSLALAVIDEQHRFGVHQRAGLRTKGAQGQPEPSFDSPPSPAPILTPHVLVMTATPIPRTLALTIYGDLDISTISALPPGRSPIATRVVTPDKSAEVYAWLRTRLDEGDQAYVVVPAIDSGATAGDADLADLRSTLKRLEEGPLAGKRLAAIHGRLKPDTREHVMSRFRAGEIDALIATTVIEVGVDVPNATIMVVENADRFGLAQLHQLRGRVGRSTKKSACILIADPVTIDGAARLAVMAQTNDGFELAERDAEIRGPGEVFGTRQAGAPAFKVADLMRDRDLLGLARHDAAAWIEASP